MASKAGRPAKYPFLPEYTFKIYDLIKQQIPYTGVAVQLGVPYDVFTHWKKTNPAVKLAIRCGKLKSKEVKSNEEAMDEYIIGRLPPHLLPFWQNMREAFQNKDPHVQFHQMAMQDRQLLFLHAWFRFNFNVTKALQFTGVKRDTLNQWRQAKRFIQMEESLREAKKDFFEDALVNCVRRGETQAVIFANKSLNKDRGYSDTKEVSIKGAIDHKHEHSMLIDLESLNLPLEIQAMIAEAMEKRKAINEDIESRADNRIHYDVNSAGVKVIEPELV